MPHALADILLVDDDEPSRQAKAELLRRAGWSVTEAPDGQATLRLVGEHTFDLVILDVQLPDMSGLEVCRQIKESSPDIMVLQTTATFVGWEDRVVGFNQGADGYLAEPVEDLEFVAQVRALLRIKTAERRQAEAEALLAHALEASAIAAWDWDLASDRSSASRGMWQLLKVKPEELGKGMPWQSYVLPEDRPMLDAALTEAIAERQALDVEFRVRRGDGEVRWLAARGRVVVDGACPRMMGVNLDITERKRAEEHAAHLAAIVAQSPDAIISYSRDHRINSWNSGAEKMFDYTAEEAIGRSVFETIVPPERHDEAERTMRYVESGRSASFETLRRRKDGSVIDVAITAAPIRDRHGNTIGKSAIVRDITARKAVERALFAAQQRMAAVLESVPVGISFSDDPSCVRVTGNPAQLRQFEAAPGANISANAPDAFAHGRHIKFLKDERQLKPEELPLQRAVAENRVIGPFEMEIELPSGRRWFSESWAAPIRGAHGEVIGGVVATADITDRKRTEQHINILMAETNHRAKNLLSVVQGIARLTAPEADPRTFAERLSQRLRALAINQELLVQTNWHGIEFSDLVHSQLEPFQQFIGTRVTLDGPQLIISAAAAQAIGMALHELATNAAKYGALSEPDGRLEVTWTLEDREPEQLFHIRWCELGGPSVKPPRRVGFGHTVIVQMVEQALKADVSLKYERQGVLWEVEVPAGRVLESETIQSPPAFLQARRPRRVR